VTVVAEKRKRRWYQYRLRTLLGLIALTAVGLGGWQYWRTIRPMRQLAQIVREAHYLSPEEKTVLQKLAWNREAWQSGLIHCFVSGEHEVLHSIDGPSIVWSGMFCAADGSNHRVFLFKRSYLAVTPNSYYVCVVTDDKCNLRLWRLLDEVHGSRFDRFRFEKAAIQSKPSPILEIAFEGWGTYQYRRLPESLDLTDVHLTDDSEVLNLTGGMRITAPWLVALKDLKKLRILELDGTDVSDAELVHLESLTKLERLSLCDTQVTFEGVERLQEALPGCEIVY
jgi:hypothetical protein